MDASTIVDLSHKLNSCATIYPGDPAFSCRPCATVAKDGYSVHALALGSHTGTHIDAPSHFFADGKTLDQIPLHTLFGPLVVVDLRRHNLQNRQMITWADIEASSGLMLPGVILVLHTGWSDYWGSPRYYDHPYLARDAAVRILERGVRILGVDTLSPDETPYQDVSGGEGFGTHEVMLGAGGIIAENLTNLAALHGHNRIGLVPLSLEGSDGSPVRAFAWKV